MEQVHVMARLYVGKLVKSKTGAHRDIFFTESGLPSRVHEAKRNVKSK